MSNGQGKIFSGFKVKRIAIDASSLGANTILAGLAGTTIKVLSLAIIVAGEVTLQFQSDDGVTPLDLTGPMSLSIDGNGFVLPPSSKAQHWMETRMGDDLILELSSAISVAGVLVYSQEDPSDV